MQTASKGVYTKMDYQMQWDEESHEEYVHFTPTRFCRTDIDNSTNDATRKLTGKYYPNFPLLHNKQTGKCEGIGFQAPRPRNDIRDDSLTDTVVAISGKIVDIQEAVGVFYSVVVDIAVDNVISWSIGTYGLYEVRGKRIGITALHAATGVPGERYFIDKSSDRWRDRSAELNGVSFSLALSPDFVEVFIHQGALATRGEYLDNLTPDEDIYKENLDPEFGQSIEPILDVLMFEAPDEAKSWPYYTLAPFPPAEGDLALLVAFHSIVGGRKDVDKEYMFTTARPPDPREVVYIHRSLGIGKVTKVGGLVNVFNSTTHMSSGAGLLNKDLQVFGISVGGFYDDPGDERNVINPPPADWTVLNALDPITKTVKLPEDATHTVGQKNRTTGVSVFHSGFVSMLNAIAP